MILIIVLIYTLRHLLYTDNSYFTYWSKRQERIQKGEIIYMLVSVKKGMFLCLITAMILVLAACSSSNGGSEDANGSSQQAAESSATNEAKMGNKPTQTLQHLLKQLTR